MRARGATHQTSMPDRGAKKRQALILEQGRRSDQRAHRQVGRPAARAAGRRAEIAQQQPGGERLRRQQEELAVGRQRVVVVPGRREDQEEARGRQGDAPAPARDARRPSRRDREEKARRQQHRQHDQRVRALRVVAPERREAGLVEVVDERRLVVDDVAVEQVAAPERVGGRRVDRFVVGEQRPARTSAARSTTPRAKIASTSASNLRERGSFRLIAERAHAGVERDDIQGAMAAPILSLVLPIYNEEAIIPELDRRLRAFLADVGAASARPGRSSSSTTARRIARWRCLTELAAAEPRYKVLSLSRNFGHQMAITAGLDRANGEAVVVMDADLQDPPEVVRQMVARWREGFDVVFGVRSQRHGETAFKRLTAARVLPPAARDAGRRSDPGRRGGLPADEPPRRADAARAARAAPVRARPRLVGRLSADLRRLRAAGPLRRRDEVSLAQDAPLRRRRDHLVLDGPAADGDLVGGPGRPDGDGRRRSGRSGRSSSGPASCRGGRRS